MNHTVDHELQKAILEVIGQACETPPPNRIWAFGKKLSEKAQTMVGSPASALRHLARTVPEEERCVIPQSSLDLVARVMWSADIHLSKIAPLVALPDDEITRESIESYNRLVDISSPHEELPVHPLIRERIYAATFITYLRAFFWANGADHLCDM